MKQILRQRRIIAGLQYQIWWDGFEKKNATWVLASTLSKSIIIPPFQVVECDRKSCGKWRLLMGEPNQKLPKEWFCEMNNDKVYKLCDLVEQDWPEEGAG